MASVPILAGGYRSSDVRIISLLFLLISGLSGWSSPLATVAMETCRFTQQQKEVASASSNGNVSLIGLFNLHSKAQDCDPSVATSYGQVRSVDAAETQRMLAAVWATEWLNERDILGGSLTIGFTGYSACNDRKTSLRRTIYSLSQEGVFDRCRGNRSNTTNVTLLGYVGPTDYSNSLAVSGLLTSLNVTHEPSRLTSLESEIRAIVSVLNRLEWDQITLIAENVLLQKQFLEASDRGGICVSRTFLLTKEVNYSVIFPNIKQSGSQVIVFLGFDYQLRLALSESTRYANLSGSHWLAAGPTVYNGFQLVEPRLDNPENVPKIYFAQSSQSKVPGFDEYLRNLPEGVRVDDDVRAFLDDCYREKSRRQPEMGSDEVPVGCPPVMSNDVIAVAENVAKLTERFLGKNSSCAAVQGSSSGASNSDANDTNDCQGFSDYLFQVPQLLTDQLNVSIMAYQLGPQNNMRFIEVGLYYNNQLIMKPEDLGILHDVGGGYFKIPRFKCPSCACVNDPDKTGSTLGDFWRVEPWVAACVTLAAVGAVLAIVIVVFIGVRICRGDAMEGSQAFAFLLLVGIILAYGSIIPFTLTSSPIVCNIRPIGIGLAYAFVFSPILARSLMLATSDPDGLLGHVSGLVQTSLFFFMVAVQLALGVQQWWLISGPEANPLSNRFDGVGCVVSTVDYSLALSYVALLLLLSLILTPFCVRNRRNYHEGLFFFLAILASLVVWISWVATFFKLDPEWKQPILCLGVVSTASVILLIVYVPRIFKMVKAINLDPNAGLQSVARHDVPSLTDVANRGSNAMICETVNHAYAPEPILVNGEGVLVSKSPSRAPVAEAENTSSPGSPTVGIVIDDSGIGGEPPPEMIDDEPEVKEITEKIENNQEKIEENGTNGVQRKPPTVTHL